MSLGDSSNMKSTALKHLQSSCGSPKNTPYTRYNGMGARGRHWDARWREGSPAPASCASDNRHGDKRAARCPPCGDGGWSGTSGRVAREGALGEGPSRAHTGRKGAYASDPQTVWAP